MSTLKQVEADLNAAIRATQELIREIRRLRTFDMEDYAREALGLPPDDVDRTHSVRAAKRNGKQAH